MPFLIHALQLALVASIFIFVGLIAARSLRIKSRIGQWAVIVSIVSIFYFLVGCAALEQGSRAVGFAAGGPARVEDATTQPSAAAALETTRGLVQTISALSPAVGQIAGLVALVAGAVGGIAGHFNGKRTQRKQAHTIVAEIVQDVAAFKDPTTPWTEDTRKLLETLGYTEAAAVEDLS